MVNMTGIFDLGAGILGLLYYRYIRVDYKLNINLIWLSRIYALICRVIREIVIIGVI